MSRWNPFRKPAVRPADQAQFESPRLSEASSSDSTSNSPWSEEPEEIDTGFHCAPSHRQQLDDAGMTEQNWLQGQTKEPQPPLTPSQHQPQQAVRCDADCTSPECRRNSPTSRQMPPRSSPPKRRGILRRQVVPSSPAPSSSFVLEDSTSSQQASSAMSGASPVRPCRALRPANFFLKQNHLAEAIFGEDYVAATKEVFYIRERPVAPQPVDGVIRSPVADGTQREWHDAFKIVYKGRDLTLLDLPSKEPILHIKKAFWNTFRIYIGGAAEEPPTATVKRASCSKLSITLEGAAHVKYEAEGDFSAFVYSISRSGERVAQVLRDEPARAAVTSKHAYGIHVAANIDCALMLAIAMVAEEMHRASG